MTPFRRSSLLLAAALATSACVSTASPVVTNVRPLPGGAIAYEECDLDTLSFPLVGTLKTSLTDCRKREKR